MLVKYEFLVLAIPTCINIAWHVTNPLVWVREVIRADPISGVALETVGRCQTEQGKASGMLFLQLQILFIAACLGYGNYLSYKVRNVPTKFSEGKWCGLCVLFCFVCLFCFVLFCLWVRLYLDCFLIRFVNT